MMNGKFCENCGALLREETRFCGNCGSSATSTPDDYLSSQHTVYRSATPASKDKTIAILLALFLGPFAWFYTIDDPKDKQKFWIGIACDVVGLLSMAVGIGFLIILGVGIWALVDVLQRDQVYYQNFQY